MTGNGLYHLFLVMTGGWFIYILPRNLHQSFSPQVAEVVVPPGKISTAAASGVSLGPEESSEIWRAESNPTKSKKLPTWHQFRRSYFKKSLEKDS